MIHTRKEDNFHRGHVGPTLSQTENFMGKAPVFIRFYTESASTSAYTGNDVVSSQPETVFPDSVLPVTGLGLCMATIKQS